MTGPNGIYADPAELITVLERLVADHPDCKIEKNAMGNLNVAVYRPTVEYIAWIDLAFPGLHYFDDPEED